MAQKGYLLVADISGYTHYLSESELDHANEILESLLNAVLNYINSPLILARVEGDAVFAYTLEDSFIQGQTLLESLEQIYFTFTNELESNDRNTTCTCNACANMNTLDLKFVVHYGEFGLQKLGTQTELVGSDVNLTHRLLKNNIVEKTNIDAYIFFTQAAIEAMMLGDLVNTMKEHTETYEHLGEVKGYVYDLSPVWQRERERRRIFVSPTDAVLSVEFYLPVPPMIAWDYINEPEARATYRFSDSEKISSKNDGRVAIGTVYHCVHGEDYNLETVVDWKPFEYVTVDSSGEAHGFTLIRRFTIRIKPENDGSRIEVLFDQPKAENPIKQAIANKLMKSILKQTREYINTFPNTLQEMVSKDKESGRLKMRLIAANDGDI